MEKGLSLEDFKNGIPLYKRAECPSDVLQKINKANRTILLNNPFWGYFTISIRPYPTKEINKYVADNDHFYFNPDYFTDKSKGDILAYIHHAVIHVMMYHIERKPSVDEDSWVSALQVSTLKIMKEFYREHVDGNNTLTAKEVREYGSLNLWFNELDEYKEMHTEHIYKEIFTKKEVYQQDMEDFKKPVSYDAKEYIRTLETLEPHGCNLSDVRDKITGLPTGIQKMMKQKAQRKVQNAVNNFGRGEMPSELKSQIDMTHEPPKVDWRVELSKYIQNLMPYDYSFRRPLKSSIGSKSRIILPGIEKNSINVTIALDTSGSVSDDLFSQFLTDVNDILNSVINPKFTIIDCDAKVQHVEKLDYGDNIYYDINTKGRHGHGGTRFEPVFDWVRNNGEQPDILIYFTDIDGSFPNYTPQYPVIWVIQNGWQDFNSIEVPFGNKIEFTE